MKKQVKKTFIGIIGGVVLFAGVIMIPYPGPGWLVVFAGLGILSTEFEWARRLLRFARGKYDAWTEWVKRQNTFVKAAIWLMTVLIVVITIWLLNGYGLINSWLGLGWDWVRSPLPIFR
jgi:uncharacterized protein (TIGR02611 family)